MKGHQEVIECLVELLRGELGARDQYFLHSRLYEDMGYARLYERINHEMEEPMAKDYQPERPATQEKGGNGSAPSGVFSLRAD